MSLTLDREFFRDLAETWAIMEIAWLAYKIIERMVTGPTRVDNPSGTSRPQTPERTGTP